MIKLSQSNISASEISAVQQVLEKQFLGMGQEVYKFEKELEGFLGSSDRQVACVNTGTSALHLAAQAIGLKHGDEVLVPSITYVATFQAISATGAKPVPCDIHTENGLLDINDAKKRISSKTKAIVFVHYASYAGNLESVYNFANQYGLRVIEDAAQAFGCTYKNHYIGSIGDICCFSFDGIKNITSGEGGAVVSNDQQVIERIKDYRLLGVQKDSENRYRQQRSWHFDVIDQGWRYHMSDIMAAIGRVQLNRLLSEFKPKRQLLINHYRERLAQTPNIKLLENINEAIIPHIFPIKINKNKRDHTRNSLERAGIQTGLHYFPNHQLSKFRSDYALPNSEYYFTQTLTLPLHTHLTYDDVDFIICNLEKALR